MKKLAITLCSAIFLSGLCAHSQDFVVPIKPVGCQIKNSPCEPAEKPACPQNCDKTPVFNSCEEIQQWKTKYCEKRSQLYTKLNLSQEQRVKAKIVDEKFFDEIAPLKMCCKTEKAKYNEMKCKKCKWSEKRAQKEKINDLKDEIKVKKKEHVKCFEEILTSCQKSEYKKLKKCDLKCKC